MLRRLRAFFLLPLLLPLSAGAWQLRQAPLMTEWAATVNPTNPWPEYPRPQLQRTNWLNLNGIWQFQPGNPGDPVPIGQLSADILVPFCMESAISGVMQHYDRAWYQRSFTLPPTWAGQRILLHFDAVDWECEPFVNGTSLGIHQGGYDPFTFDITPYLQGTGPQTLTVRIYSPVDNTSGQTLQPLGKQRLSPSGIWYTACSGIWQTVWLEPVPATSISDLHLVPDIDQGRLAITAAISGPANGISLVAEALDGTNSVAVTAASAGQNTISLTIPSPKLWSPTNPFLYNLRLTLTTQTGLVDSVDSYFGMRKISLGTDGGFVKMLLNNQFLFQFGPLDQGYWPDGIYTPPSDVAMRRDIELVKSLGFNLIRKHMKVEPARYYYWADRMGMLIWQDMPSMLAGATISDASKPVFENELSRMIQTHWNAPSIIVWTVFNEGWGQYDTVRISSNVMAQDPSRLVNCASGWTYYNVGHLQDSHSYPNPSCPGNPSRAVVNGEFGGVGLGLTNHTWASGWGYVGATNGLDLTARFEGFCGQLSGFIRNQGLSAAVYTQTTDVETELNGLYTYDRALRKPSLLRIQSSVNSLIGTPPQLSIPLTNASFEFPQLSPPTYPPFTNLAQISGWTFPTATSSTTSGVVAVDPGQTSDLSSQALRLGSQDGAAFQTTTHTLAPNEVYTFTLDSGNTAAASSLQLQLFYQAGSSRVTLASTNLSNVFDPNVPDGILRTFSLTVAATPESVGYPLGVQFRNLGPANGATELFDNARLTFTTPAPMVLKQPVGGVRYIGIPISLAPLIAGQQPLQFQWQHQGTNVPFGTNLALTLTQPGLTDAGDYVLYATNAFGWTNTATATLTLAAPTLAHRYSFATDLTDSIGGPSWRGTAYGGARVAGGQLTLDGVNGSYAQLPAGILANDDAVSLEAWASFGVNGSWARLFDFGDQNSSGQGRYYLMCTPHSGPGDTRLSITDTDPGSGHEELATAPGVLDGQTNVHIVAVVYPAAGIQALYLNGNLAALNAAEDIPLASVQDNLNFLGRSLYTADAWLKGSIDEFRIYNGALSPSQIALNYSSGPASVVSDPGALLAVRLVVNTNMAALQGQQALLLGDFANISNVNLFAYGNPAISSSDPGIVSVSPSGYLVAQRSGTAVITATYGAFTCVASIQVATEPFGLLHRYSFTADATDSVGGPAWSGTLQGHAVISGGQVVLDGTAGTYVSLPAGLLNGLDAVTIEGWAGFGANGSWAELFSFGDQTASGTGQTYIALIPHSGAGDTRISIRNPFAPYSAEQFGAAPGTLDGQTNVHFAAVWNATAGYEALYLNGSLAASSSITIPLATINNALSYLGRSLWNADPLLVGSIDEFRIYKGALNPAEISADYAGGPAMLPLPSLVATAAGPNLRLSWPAWATRYSLFSSTQLGPGAQWRTVAPSPGNDGTNFVVVLPPSASATFFRLSN